MSISRPIFLTVSKLLMVFIMSSFLGYCYLEQVDEGKSTVYEDNVGASSGTQDVVQGAADNASQLTETKENQNISLSKSDIYKAGFMMKRAEQIAAVKQMMEIQDYAKQYKMVKLILEKIFQILSSSKLEITQSTYIPGQEFPENRKELDALAHIVENTAFFGDILLRIPDITHKIYNSNKEWRLLVHWSVGFCNETGIFDGGSEKLLSLVGQELKLLPRDPTYVNPYKADYQMQELQKKARNQKQEKKTSTKTKSKKRKGGPRLSRTDL